MSNGEEQAMPKWQKSPPQLVSIFEEAVRELAGVEVRKMFGYPCAFVNGQMCAGLHQESMIVRLGPDDRADLLAEPGASPFEPMAGRPMREYVVVPPAVLGQSDELGRWLAKAVSYTRSLPAKAAKPRSGRGTKPAKPKTR